MNILLRPQKPLPRALIYHNPKSKIHTIFSTKTGETIGRIEAKPLEKYLWIDKFDIFKHRREGYGKELMNYAKHYSKQKSSGKIMLIASPTEFDPVNPPYIFYRKQGFSTHSKSTDSLIDKYIKKGKQFKTFQIGGIYMYYTPQKNLSKLEKIKNFLIKLLIK